MANNKAGTAGPDQSTNNARNRDLAPLSTTVARQADTALKFAKTGTGLTILAGLAATIAGLFLSRDRRVRAAAADAGAAVRDMAYKGRQAARSVLDDAVGNGRATSGQDDEDTETDESIDQMLDTIHVA